ESERRAHRPIEPAACLRIPDEVLLRGIPLERSARPDREVREVADGHRTMTELDVADRPATRADRILPILVVAAAPIEAQRSGSKRLGGDVLGLGEEVAAVDRDLPVASDELDAVHADRAAMDGHAVLITERDVLASFARRLDLDGTLEIPPEPPLRDVEVMRPPIGHHAARELAEIAPRERVKAWMEGHLARGPEPEIPVEAGWSLLGGK